MTIHIDKGEVYPVYWLDEGWPDFDEDDEDRFSGVLIDCTPEEEAGYRAHTADLARWRAWAQQKYDEALEVTA